MAVPCFGDKTLADGTVVPGPANHLPPFVGDAKSFSEPSSRYLRFIGPASLHSWGFMRAKVGDAPGSLSVQKKNSAGMSFFLQAELSAIFQVKGRPSWYLYFINAAH